jgi:hypothetical protein
MPVSSPPVTGFLISGSLATPISVTRPNRVSLALRLACLPREASPDGLLRRTLAWLPAERAIVRVSSFQLTRSARLGLAHQITPIPQIKHLQRQVCEIGEIRGCVP